MSIDIYLIGIDETCTVLDHEALLVPEHASSFPAVPRVGDHLQFLSTDKPDWLVVRVVWAISGGFTPAGQHTRGPLVMIRPLDHAYAACIGEPADAEWNPYGHYWIQNGPDPQTNPSPSPHILHPEASCEAPPPDSPPLAP